LGLLNSHAPFNYPGLVSYKKDKRKEPGEPPVLPVQAEKGAEE
jgi:hypothetical protein